MLEKYKTVYEGGEGEIVEKKSRFIATVRPVQTEEEEADAESSYKRTKQGMPEFRAADPGSYICSCIDSDRAGGDLRNSDDPCIFSCGDPAASDDFLLNDTDHCQTAAERKKTDFEKDSE